MCEEAAVYFIEVTPSCNAAALYEIERDYADKIEQGQVCVWVLIRGDDQKSRTVSNKLFEVTLFCNAA